MSLDLDLHLVYLIMQITQLQKRQNFCLPFFYYFDIQK